MFTKTPSTIISYEEYSVVNPRRKLDIKAQDHHHALAGGPVGTACVSQLPSSLYLKIDPQT